MGNTSVFKAFRNSAMYFSCRREMEKNSSRAAPAAKIFFLRTVKHFRLWENTRGNVTGDTPKKSIFERGDQSAFLFLGSYIAVRSIITLTLFSLKRNFRPSLFHPRTFPKSKRRDKSKWREKMFLERLFLT